MANLGTWELAGILTVLGMATVLIVLFVINLMIRGMGYIFQVKKVPAVPAPVAAANVAVSPVAVQDESDELVAVITAALSVCMGGSASTGLVVRPFAAPATSSAWAVASRAENTQK